MTSLVRSMCLKTSTPLSGDRVRMYCTFPCGVVEVVLESFHPEERIVDVNYRVSYDPCRET